MPDTQQKILSVSDLNNQAKKLLEQSIGDVQVEGEISNFTCASSGHWYFSLKDDKAQVSCAMFIGANKRVKTTPENGDKVIITAIASIYAARGNYQLIASSMEQSGYGNWHIEYAKLYEKLAKEGLFASDIKRSLPKYPTKIGIIGSQKGAALQDILRTIKRRYPATNVAIYPASAQGQTSEKEVIQALATAEQDNTCQVLIIARGGGSIEDLWTFNLETVARATASCKIPTISAIGHETDNTIIDFVADVRASTPTAAAELATPDIEEVKASICATKDYLQRVIKNKLDTQAQEVDQLTAHLRHPQQSIELKEQRVKQLQEKLNWQINYKLTTSEASLKEKTSLLEKLDYRRVLKRGFSIATDDKGRVIKKLEQAKQANKFKLEFQDGRVDVQVKE